MLRTCGHLFAMPIIPVFVFDGDRRPHGKHGRNIHKNTTTREIEFWHLLNAFSFEWRQTPGEAEAELTSMSKAGIIDAVLSEDSDALIFGAKHVLRMYAFISLLHGDQSVFNVTVYDSLSCGLTTNDMMFIALLAKGDYGPGLPGCSARTALELSRAGFSHNLLHAVETMDPYHLGPFLNVWHNELKNKLRTNNSGMLFSCCPSLANAIPNDYP
ncbi:PIN domain-like protein, partial [Armillaria gallica]